MTKEAVDVQAERAKFHQERQAKIDAENEKNQPIDVRTGDNGVNPPSVRATDGGEVGTKERSAIEVAAENDAAAAKPAKKAKSE